MCATFVTIHGYKCQEYEVTTDDGYILSVQRIPEGRVGDGGQNRQPVLLQHGVLVDYWNWTWDDLVVHDLPTVANLVFKQTGQKTHYVGHSLGTLIALASFSEGRQIDKIKSAARSFVGEITTILGLAEFNPTGQPVSIFVKALCAYHGVDCYDFMTALTAVRDGILKKYDYGSNNYNLAHYGEAKPPQYNLANIPRDLPLFISYGGQDALSDSKDVETLLDYLKLHDVDKLHVQYIKEYVHAYFTAKDIVFNQIVNFFRNQH